MKKSRTEPADRYTGRRLMAGLPGGHRNVEVLRHTSRSASALPERQDLRNHSPSGLEWGYGGSGPAQLALAILADAIGEDRAKALYQDFKWEVISRLDQNKPWVITRGQILEWAAHQNPDTDDPEYDQTED